MLVKVDQSLSSLRLLSGMTELSGIIQALLIDLSVERLAFTLLDFEFSLKVLLLSVHLGLVLQGVLV